MATSAFDPDEHVAALLPAADFGQRIMRRSAARQDRYATAPAFRADQGNAVEKRADEPY
jgi:hypothetical protein